MSKEKNLQELIDSICSLKNGSVSTQKELIERIKSGETTGDPIRDFSIIYYGLQKDNEKEKRLKEIQQEILENQQQQVLVVNEKEHIGGCTGFGHPGYYEREEEQRLGSLRGKLTFDLKKGDILIPTTKYVQRNSRTVKFEEWKLHEGQISISGYDFSSLDKEMPQRGPFEEVCGGFESLQRSLRIIIGNKKAELFFRLPKWDYWRVLEKIISKEIDEKELSLYLQNRGGWNVSYAPALKLLEANIPEDLKEKYNEAERNKKIRVLENIRSYTEKIDVLEEKIKKIYDSTKKGGFTEDGALTIVENEDDAKVVSFGQRQELENTQENLKNELRKAVELGMSNNDEKIKLEPGVELHIGKYINGLLQKYEIVFPTKTE